MLALAPTVHAGPPFITDDAEPTDRGHWEIYNFVAGASVHGAMLGQGGFDINYGVAKDLQLTAVIPLNYDLSGVGKAGLGDIELAAKYRFLHQTAATPMPDVALFPRVLVPSDTTLAGPERVGLVLPIWGQKDFGPWSLFGGGGYEINPDPGQKNFWLSGVAIQRELTDRLAIGAEVYHQTTQTAGGKPITGINLGFLYKLITHWSLIAAGGPGIENPDQGGRYDFYLALKADY